VTDAQQPAQRGPRGRPRTRAASASSAPQRFLGEQIPGARVHIFPADVASSHFPFLQNPHTFNDQLTDFLE